MPKEDAAATQKGVAGGEGDQETGAVGTRTSRDDYMDSLAARRTEQFNAEHGVTADAAAAVTTTDQVATQAAAEPKKDEADLGLASQLGKQLDDGTFVLDPSQLDKVLVNTKVDGVETLVPITKVTAQYQKNGAADARLQHANTEAARIVAEANAALAAAKEAAGAATTVKAKKETEATVAAAQDNLRQIQKKMFDSIYTGDQEAAMKSFDEALDIAFQLRQPARAESATPDTDAIVASTTKAVTQQLSVQSALTKLYADYPTIETDSDLSLVADRKRAELEATGVPRAQAISQAGEYVGAKFKLEKATTVKDVEQQESTTRAQKLAAKEGLDEPNSTAARAATAAPLPQTASQTIAEMQRARAPG